MPRYFIDMSFKGTRYHGWQLQPNALTVQAEIEKALHTITRSEIATTGAGRTDAGVHASHFIAHFDIPLPLNESIPNFVYSMNALLPQDIVIHSVYPVKAEAHARFSALSRTYRYSITREKDPFHPEFSWYFPYPLDMDTMNTAAARLIHFTDFTSFSKLHTDVKTNNCRIFHASWTNEDSQFVFTIRADRFLRNMVRAVVGTLLETGRGKMNIEQFNEIIEGKNRNLAGPSVPPHGLMLCHIEYKQDILL